MCCRLDDPEVKDVDFCHVPVPQQQGQQQGFELLATVGGHGVCQVWKVQESGAQEVVRLELPKGKQRLLLIHCWVTSCRVCG